MKKKLIILSLSPLAFLTIIRNFNFTTSNSQGATFPIFEFFLYNRILIIVLSCCFLWLVSSFIIFIEFNAFKWADKKSGYEVIILEDKEDASLNFFLTLIIPLLLDDVVSLQGALTFAFLILLILLLLYRTNLFYANPILALLGYKVYRFKFKDNPEMLAECYIGLSNGAISNNGIEYKKITNNVIYIKEMST